MKMPLSNVHKTHRVLSDENIHLLQERKDGVYSKEENLLLGKESKDAITI